MRYISPALLTDGSSDKTLINPLNWLFADLKSEGVIDDFSPVLWINDLLPSEKRTKGLSERLKPASTLAEENGCDLLLIHRDAENESYKARAQEIDQYIQETQYPPVIRVVTVKMMEAWLLFDTLAICRAAGRPFDVSVRERDKEEKKARQRLQLPPWNPAIETKPAKTVLENALAIASGLSGRRLDDFKKPGNITATKKRLADGIENYAPLRSLPAFKKLEEEIRHMVQNYPTP